MESELKLNPSAHGARRARGGEEVAAAQPVLVGRRQRRPLRAEAPWLARQGHSLPGGGAWALEAVVIEHEMQWLGMAIAVPRARQRLKSEI